MCPGVDDLVVTFIIGDKAHVVVLHDLLHFGISFLDEGLFLFGNNHILQVERKTSSEGHGITQVLDVVEILCRTCYTAGFDHFADDVTQ